MKCLEIPKGFGRRGRDRMVVGFTTTYATSNITTNVVSSNTVRRGVLNATLCDNVSDLLHVGGFLQVVRFPPPIKLAATI